MNNPQKNRRSYGFTDRSEPRRARSYGEVREDRPKKTQPKPRPRRAAKGSFDWQRLALLPFKILGYILGGIWGLWKVRPKLPKDARRWLRKKMLFVGTIVVVFGLLGSVIMVALASRDLPDPDKLTDRRVAQSTKIYDRTGEHLLFEIFNEEKRTLVTLEDIPQQLIDGVIATEDTAFYEHHGIRPLSILRALAYGLLPGRRVSGTSTLTQQLVKNAILTNERKISRKIKEIILSLRLEQKYSKDQILQIYFNEIPYGSTNYGIEAASQSYFGKTVSELNLQESATLAGMPKAPTRYLNDPEALLERRNFVLRRMFEEGYITEEEKNAAQAEELTLSRHFGDIQAPHFVLYVKEQLVEMFDEQTVDSGGLKVITTLDWDKQEIAQTTVDERGTEILEEAGGDNMALVAMDPRTGQILSMIGSKDFDDDEIDGKFNVATLGKRQPGSSFKPIVYTAAFEKGYTPETVLFDVVTNFAASGRDYQPLNYDLAEHGPVSIRQALQGSLNIPAVKALYLVGDQKGVEFAERLGYSTLSEGDFGLSLVLGGGEVKLLDHVAAYSVFANNGTYYEPVSILSVEDNSGDVLFEWKKPKGEKVLEPEIAATISNVLSDDAARAYAFGTGGVLTVPERPVAAKTGTTNGYIDAWTIGYTPSLVTGVWGGNTDNTAMTQGFGGSRVAGPIWQQFMTQSLDGSSVESFPAAPENDATKPVLRGSEGGAITLRVNKVTGNLATSSTPEHLIVERTYTQPHSILHYVYKDDPRGSEPENPGDDPQYQIWEDSIQDWIRRQQEENPDWEISFEEPPTQEDDEYSLELIPEMTVVFPQENATLFSRQINTDIRVTAPRGVSKVTYQIDDKFVGVVREHPFNLNYYAREFDAGEHVLTIIVEDDIGNRLEQEIPFVLDVPEEPAGVSWIDGNVTLGNSDFPRTFFLSPFKLEQIEQVSIFGERDGAQVTLATITDFSDLFNNQIDFTWNSKPESGVWSLIAVVRRSDGSSGESDRISVIIE